MFFFSKKNVGFPIPYALETKLEKVENDFKNLRKMIHNETLIFIVILPWSF